MSVINVRSINPVFLKLDADQGVLMELSEHFSFMINNYGQIKKKNPTKYKHWDGKIRLFKKSNRLLYAGLFDKLKTFCKDNDYEIALDENDKHLFCNNSFSVSEAEDFINILKLPNKPREYQIKAFINAIRYKTRTFLSPTASGKSLIIYLITKYLLDINQNNKILIVVPDVPLVHQMSDDFVTYGCEENRIHRLYANQVKHSEKEIIISTWQSINQIIKSMKNTSWLDQFDTFIIDEVHCVKETNIITDILENSMAQYRYGFTATLDDLPINESVVQGLIGPIETVTTIEKLIKDNHISNLLVKVINLNYPDIHKKFICRKKYSEEIDYLVRNKKRNDFIINLALSLKGNTIIFFRLIDAHGKKLLSNVKAKTNRPVFFYSGEVDGKERNDIRKQINEETDAIWLVSTGSGSTGINVPNIHNIIFAHPSKKRGKVLQSLGRGMRLHSSKTKLLAFDIVDDLVYKGVENFSYRHYKERIKTYSKEKIQYKLYDVNLYS